LDGVAVIDPRNVPVNTQPPKIALQNIAVDGQPVVPTNKIRLPPGKGNVQFEYTGICLQAPEKVRFKYMLEGFDDDWVDAGTRRVATYANLPPQTYHFLLRAGNNDEIWTPTPASFAFTLAPHFYQRTSFYIGAIALTGLALVGIHAWRVRAHAFREKELSALVTRRTQHLEDAMKSMETFTYSIAHDLRAPLRAIRGITDLLLEDYGKHMDQTGRDYSNAVTESVQKMDALLCDLLAYGQVAHAKTSIQKVDLKSTLESVRYELDPQIQAKKAVIDIAWPLQGVMANVQLLHQVLINLVSNGIKFVAPEKTPHLRIWTETQKDKVRIIVEDNGIGIEGKYQERIFWLFERLHPGRIFPGTGVGLAIVQKAVERMGGIVGVESEYGKGSRFWVEFPAAT
jgi:signal transduction histidine kinase